MRHARQRDPGELRQFSLDARCRLLVKPIAEQRRGRRHHHDLYELVVVRRGRGLHELDGREWPLVAGEVFVVHPGVAHQYTQAQDLALTNLLFAPLDTWLQLADLPAAPGYAALFGQQSSERPGGRMRLQPDEMEEVWARCRRLHRELHDRSTGWRSLVAGELLALVSTLVRLWPLRGDDDGDPVLTALVGWIHEHHASALGLPLLAHRAGLSMRSLQRRFHDRLGQSPLAYLEQVRLERAAHLLSDPRRSIAAVAEAVGFSDPSYFARRWRRRYGVAPHHAR